MKLAQWIQGIVYLGLLSNLWGCVATENLVHVPEHSHMANIDDYNTALHRQSVHIFNPMPIDTRVAQFRLEPRVAHLIFVIDQSSALDSEFRGIDTRFYAKEVIRRFVKTMPNQSFSSTVITYNDAQNPQIFAPLDARFSVAPLLPRELENALSGDRAPQHIEVQTLSVALDFVSELVGNLAGPSAVVLVTAWSQIDESVEHAVMRMRQRVSFAHNAHILMPESSAINWPHSQAGLCFYTIGVGNRMSRSRLENADSCGFSAAVDKVAQASTMANFVESVLYKGPADEDKDGIYDYQDRCPNTQYGKIVDYSGCPRFPANRFTQTEQ